MSTDDTMRRIEEDLNILITVERERAADGAPETRLMRADFLATIRAALQDVWRQPQPPEKVSEPGSWRDSRGVLAQKDAGGWGEDDDRHRANEAVRLMQQDALERRPDGWLRREEANAEHERAVEAWAARFDSAMLSYSHDWGLPDEEAYKPFGVAEKHAAIRALLNDGVRLMRRQPKETP